MEMLSAMRICHLIATNFYGGPERQICQHARMMMERGHWLRIISFMENSRQTELMDTAASLGIPVLGLSGSHPFDPRPIWKLRDYLAHSRVDILCTHGYKSSVLGRIASWMAGCRQLVISRGWTGETRRVRCYEMLDRIFLRLADAVVAVSEGQRQKILACGVNSDKVRVIHNAIDLAAYPGPANKSVRTELGIPKEAILVATAGRFSPEKNHMGLVEAATRVLEEMPDVYFVVFGEGFLRSELEKAVADAGIGHRFFLPGFRSDVRSLLHDIDIFVLPSHTEGLPNVVLEAFACRKPVVATCVGGTPEVVSDGVSGFLAPRGDMDRLAQGVLALAGDAALREQMGRRGYLSVEEEYGFERQTNLYLQIYGNVGD
ncbi:MAG: glycosyltransferase [Desulfomicrobium sp.]